MMPSNVNKCVKCKKAIKSSEIVLVCGLWCRKSFHNQCLGLSNTEARAALYSKVRMKFHCEVCEKRLAIQLLGGKETQEARNLENCVSLLELVQKLVKLTNRLSDDNSTINSKLDAVISSNARLEEYILQSTNSYEKQTEETLDNSDGYAGSRSTKGISEIREQNNNTNSQDQIINNGQMCRESEFQKTEVRPNFQPIAYDFAEKVADGQQQNFTESCSSNCQEEWEEPEGHETTHDPLSIDEECMQDWEQPDYQDSMQDSLSIVKEECPPPEDFLVNEDKAMMEDDGEKYSASEDFLQSSTLNTEKTGNEKPKGRVSEDHFEELQQQMESTTGGGEAESSNPAGVEDDKIDEDSHGLAMTISLGARTSHRIKRTKEQAVSSGSKIVSRKLGHGSDVCKKTPAQVQDLKEHAHADSCELLYSCCICKKTFRKSSYLNRHFRLHSGERPYSCQVCNKTFLRRSDLKRHSMLHLDEGPYRCKVCHKEFISMCDMSEHSQLHTGERQYTCKICQSQFAYYSNWRNHMLLHS